MTSKSVSSVKHGDCAALQYGLIDVASGKLARRVRSPAPAQPAGIRLDYTTKVQEIYPPTMVRDIQAGKRSLQCRGLIVLDEEEENSTEVCKMEVKSELTLDEVDVMDGSDVATAFLDSPELGGDDDNDGGRRRKRPRCKMGVLQAQWQPQCEWESELNNYY